MPFVTQAHRTSPDLTIPGDRCYVHYKWMVEAWKKEPRWTTADTIYAKVMDFSENCKDQCAKELAWQVFFIKYVMPYEDLKEAENGTI